MARTKSIATPAGYAIRAFVEFIGTFIFLSVIFVCATLSYGGVVIGLALTSCIFFGGYISGGHFNPAVSIMFAASGKLGWLDLVLYVIAQILGGLAAWGVASGAEHVGYHLLP